MAYQSRLLENRVQDGLGFGEAAVSCEVTAGYGECTKCGCTAFEGGTNANQCQNSSCGHAKDDHRY